MSAQSILQSGQITPGHSAVWTTDGVLQDGGGTPAAQRVIASLRGANFNTTSDQPIIIPLNFTAFNLTSIIVTNASSALSNAQGGFYPAPLKGGALLVASSQAYSALTGPTLLMNPTLQASVGTTRYSANNLVAFNGYLAIYFSLTIPQGSLATADVFLVGIDLS